MKDGDYFLVVDVGATKVLLFLARYENKGAKLEKEKEYKCKDFDSLESVILEFLEDKKIPSAVIGAPGPVLNGECTATNLSWNIDQRKIEKHCKIKRVIVLNDLELQAHGMMFLKKKNLTVIQEGEQKEGVKVLLSIGTGLGQAIVDSDKAFPSEGGHQDFAASSEEEINFLHFMKKSLDHVSYERVLSGEGVKNVYQFFSGKRDLTSQEIFLKDKKTVDFFTQVLGKQAGNFALTTLCYGGVYLTGGVLQKNSTILSNKNFLEGFRSKGRVSSILNKIPVYLIKDRDIFLLGGLKILLTSLNF